MASINFFHFALLLLLTHASTLTNANTQFGQESNPAPAKTYSPAVDLNFRRTDPTLFNSQHYGPAVSGVATAAPSTDSAVVAVPLGIAVVLLCNGVGGSPPATLNDFTKRRHL